MYGQRIFQAVVLLPWMQKERAECLDQVFVVSRSVGTALRCIGTWGPWPSWQRRFQP